MSTYHDEQIYRLRLQAVKARKYTYRATGYDLFDPRDYFPADGSIVIKIQPNGCPKNGTFGQCYIGDPETGEFIGLVDERSLTPTR